MRGHVTSQGRGFASSISGLERVDIGTVLVPANGTLVLYETFFADVLDRQVSERSLDPAVQYLVVSEARKPGYDDYSSNHLVKHVLHSDNSAAAPVSCRRGG